MTETEDYSCQIVPAPCTDPAGHVGTRQPPPRTNRRDPQSRLIGQLLALAGEGAAIISSRERRWASATFIGIQHRIVLQLDEPTDGDRAARFAQSLPEAEFFIPGHIVADAVVDEIESDWSDAGRRSRLHLTILTIEDW